VEEVSARENPMEDAIKENILKRMFNQDAIEFLVIIGETSGFCAFGSEKPSLPFVYRDSLESKVIIHFMSEPRPSFYNVVIGSSHT
jgi:hypothetical protein